MSSEHSVTTPASWHAARSILSQCDRLNRDRKSKEVGNECSVGIRKGNTARARVKATSTAAGDRCPWDCHQPQLVQELARDLPEEDRLARSQDEAVEQV